MKGSYGIKKLYGGGGRICQFIFLNYTIY